MSAHRPWERDSQPAPSWARNLTRRAYLVALETPREEADGDAELEAAGTCQVGDVIVVTPTVLPPHEGGASWQIVRREAADPPFAARLVVRPA